MRQPAVLDAKLLREEARRNPGWFRRTTSRLRPLPDFLIVGAQKSGTTSLYSYVMRHPAIRPPRLKELHFLDREFARGTHWYRAQFPLSVGGRRVWRTGEATPYYLAHPLVPARAAALMPNARILAVLRNPIDRAYSHYRHSTMRGQETRTFEAAIDAEQEMIAVETGHMAADPTYRSLSHERQSYLTRGLYAEQLEHWFAEFPRDQVLVLVSEKLFEAPIEQMSRVFDFLGLSEPLSGEQYQATKRGSYDEPLQAATRARLAEFFRPHNQRLSTLLRTEFDWDR